MKKSKIIALALASAMIFMGAGYAAWQDNVTIKSEVSTGTFDVRFCDDNVLEKYNEAYKLPIQNSYLELKDPEIKDDTHGEDKILSIDVGNFYPSNDVTKGHGWFGEDGEETPAIGINAVIKNVGSIPAKFDNAIITHSGSDKVYEQLRVESGYLVKLIRKDIYVYNKNTKQWVYKKTLERWEDWPSSEELGPECAWDDMSLADFQVFLNESLSGYELTNDEVVFWGSKCRPKAGVIKDVLVPYLQLYIHEDAGNDTQETNCTVNIKFNWKPFNVE